MGSLTSWIDHYGYAVLFGSLLLELLALPLPGEILMSYSGFLVFEGKLNWFLCILMAGMGTCIGMTISYLIGLKLGTPFFHKYGPRFHMGPEKLEKTSKWFSKYGNKLLLFAYFIPGVRHITGYFSGITGISFRTYAPYAYIGAFLWVSTFISLGKVLGPKWEQFHHSITKYLMYGGILAAFILALIYLSKKYKQQVIEFATIKLGGAMRRSPWRVRILIIGSGAVFVVLFGIMIGLIQDFLSNEFVEFDNVTRFLVHALFPNEAMNLMKQFDLLASLTILIPLILLTFLWIIVRSKDRFLEILFLLSVTIGGEILDEGLRRIFHRVGPLGSTPAAGVVPYTFPSEQSLMALTVYGFAAYVLIRHSRNVWVRTIPLFIVAIAALFVGLSRIYLDVQFPSDVIAGYVFGGVWLSLNIVLLEIFRLLRKNN